MINSDDLRQRAKKRYTQQSHPQSPEMAAEELIAELQLHKIELEIQNEELQRAQEALETSRRHYKELYQLAPIGYLTLDAQAHILSTNQHALTQLEVERVELLNQNFTVCVILESQDVFYLFHRHLINSGEHHSCELRLKRGEDDYFEAQLTGKAVFDEEAISYIRLVIADITEPKQLLQEREELLSHIAHQNQKLRALSNRVLDIQEAERNLLAEELHDKVGQHLALVKINLSLIRPEVITHLSEAHELHIRLKQSEVLVQQTIDLIRNVMAELHPHLLRRKGLVAALHWYSEYLSEWVKYTIEIEAETPSLRFPEMIESTLFRIAQEALHNITKHAKTSRVHIVLRTTTEPIHFSIEDDGIGFKVPEFFGPHNHGSWGLMIMRERAERIGGTLEIFSEPGQGARIVVEIPAATIEGLRDS